MKSINYLKDTPFLEKLVKEKTKTIYSKVVILDKEELPLESIEGQITTGNINIQGNAAVRRTGTLTFIAKEEENNLTNINNILSINKKIKIFIGIKNDIDINYDKIIWFPLGIFVITQPNIVHNLSGVTISLNFKDKMCLLNGECGGTLPTSVTFHEYNQIIGYFEIKEELSKIEQNDYTIYGVYGKIVKNEQDIEKNGYYKIEKGEELNYYKWDNEYGWQEGDYNLVGTIVSRPQTIFNIIQTLVLNYGNENPAKVFINDIPLEIKSLVRYTGSKPLYYNGSNHKYSFNISELIEENIDLTTFNYNDDVGYVYTSFTYPGELISGIGENICSVLDKIKNVLGNYEYFYDIEGNFIFQEIKNYLNTSFDFADIIENQFILDNNNYQIGFNNVSKVIYNFEEGNGLINSFSNNPNYLNIKNNFHIWGKNKDELPIHYHVAIKSKPVNLNAYYVVYLKDENDEYTGKIRLANIHDFSIYNGVNKEELTLEDDEALIRDIEKEFQVVLMKKTYTTDKEILYLTKGLIIRYIPTDWRAELYLQGLRKRENGIRPDVFEQELLDNFDSIYDFKEKKYKVDMANNPNSLKYYIDFLEPTKQIHDCSIDALGLKTYTYQQDKINRLYNKDVPNLILINNNYNEETKKEIRDRCEKEGQSFSTIEKNIYNQLSIGTSGYSAHETARELLYQYTNYNESISITSIPIYYLDANNRISVYDKASNIYGDYIIISISLPLNGKTAMSISATRALERI